MLSSFGIAIETKVRITKSEISMRIWRSSMSAASQGAFVDISEILLGNISEIIKIFGQIKKTHARVLRYVLSFFFRSCVNQGKKKPATSI